MKIFNKKMSLMFLPTPLSISFFWNMGFLLGFCLMMQFLTGLMLSMNYLSYIDQSFYSVIHIMRDVSSGWMFRYIHLNGASFFFILMYMHLARGIFFFSPIKLPLVWLSGVMIFLISMMTAFMGYVLPWGQMSYWGATVITSMLTSIPYLGSTLILWLWGDFSVSQPMLNRMLSLHFMFPMFLLVLVFFHLMFLHKSGSSNPSGSFTNFDKMKFYPYFIIKDLMSMLFILILMIVLVCLMPFLMGDPENFSKASIYSTPTHIKPEWYFLFAYAILRCIPSKLGGVVMMLLSILIISILSISMKGNKTKFNPKKKLLFFTLVFLMLLLTWMGGNHVNDVTMMFAQMLTVFYFFSMFMLM